MNFIYDILLNFDDLKLYDYYEWDEKDNIEYVKKIPIYKINSEVFLKILQSTIQVNKNFLLDIYNKTEIYERTVTKKIEYACLFTNGDSVIAIEFDYDGRVLATSKLLVDEENEVVNDSFEMDESEITFIFLDEKKFNPIYLTRSEEKKNHYLISELNNIYKMNEYEKLKYFYYEIGIKIGSIEEHKKIIRELGNTWNENNEYLYNLLMTTYNS